MKIMNGSDWAAEKAKCRTKLDNALMKLVFGALAVVWSLLVGEKTTPLMQSGKMRDGLLVVAFGAVLALILNYLEQLAAFKAAEMRTPGVPMPSKPFDYSGLKTRSSIGKHLVGTSAMLLLLVMLTLTLFTKPARAETEEPSIENLAQPTCWCGGDSAGFNYKTFVFTYSSNVFQVQVREEKPQESSKFESCEVTNSDNEHLDLSCREDRSLTVHVPLPTKKDTFIKVAWEDNRVPEESQRPLTLVKCNY